MKRLTGLMLLLMSVLGAAVVAPPAYGAQTVTGEFSGQCRLTGTVVPYSEFRGTGTCSGLLNGDPVANIAVEAYARAYGLTIPQGPILQQGSGSITFADAARTAIAFTFDQTASVLKIRGNVSGDAVGEVALLPLKPDSTTRQAVVSANTITGLVG